MCLRRPSLLFSLHSLASSVSASLPATPSAVTPRASFSSLVSPRSAAPRSPSSLSSTSSSPSPSSSPPRHLASATPPASSAPASPRLTFAASPPPSFLASAPAPAPPPPPRRPRASGYMPAVVVALSPTATPPTAVAPAATPTPQQTRPSSPASSLHHLHHHQPRCPAAATAFALCPPAVPSLLAPPQLCMVCHPSAATSHDRTAPVPVAGAPALARRPAPARPASAPLSSSADPAPPAAPPLRLPISHSISTTPPPPPPPSACASMPGAEPSMPAASAAAAAAAPLPQTQQQFYLHHHHPQQHLQHQQLHQQQQHEQLHQPMSLMSSSADSSSPPSDGTPVMSSSDSHNHNNNMPPPPSASDLPGAPADDQHPRPAQSEQLSAAAIAAAAAAGTTTTAADTRPDSDAALSTSTITSADSAERMEPASAADDEAAASHPDRLAFRAGVVCIPHPDKADKGGEDAFFVQGRALGVFDGVGGWSSIGVDPGLYSKELARLTASYIARDGPAAAVDALRAATEHNRAIGSSTACVVGIDDERDPATGGSGSRLVGVNLGDSGLIVIRAGAVVFRTSEQQHYFNCPFQIGTDSFDTVDAGAPVDFALQQGDCIVMGTDGLWDNVFTDRIVAIVGEHYAQAVAIEPETADDDVADADDHRSDASSKGGEHRADAAANTSTTSTTTTTTAAATVPKASSSNNEVDNSSSSSTRSARHNAGNERASPGPADATSMVSELEDARPGSPGATSSSESNVTMESSGGVDDDPVDEDIGVNGVEVAQTIAQSLADAAIRVANDERGTSPFAVNARNAGHMFLGGKVDDVTIISAIVVDADRVKGGDAMLAGDIGLVGPRRGTDSSDTVVGDVDDGSMHKE